jgi:hypothetical protein
MVEGVRDHALSAGLIDEKTWVNSIDDLYRGTASEGTFCYAFFEAVAKW